MSGVLKHDVWVFMHRVLGYVCCVVIHVVVCYTGGWLEYGLFLFMYRVLI